MTSTTAPATNGATDTTTNGTPDAAAQVNENGEAAVRKFRGVPEDVQLFEVFWQQVVQLIKVCNSIFHCLGGILIHHIQARPDLSIQDITALFVSLTNLSLSCYPDRLEYVDQVLAYAAQKIQEFSNRYGP